MNDSRRLRAAALGLLAVFPVASACAAPVDDAGPGANVALRTRADWDSAAAIDRTVRASGGRPTLIEFYDTSRILT